MENLYFYGQESEQYTFFRIPKVLFMDIRYKKLSLEAKVLYGLMLDRMSLSRRNGWFDSQGRVYIYFTLQEATETIGCSKSKAVSLFAELDTPKGIGLIERRKQGLGKPAILYVKKFVSIAYEENVSKLSEIEFPELQILDVKKKDIRYSEGIKIESQDVSNIVSNNTDISNIDFINSNPSINPQKDKIDMMGEERDCYITIIKNNISYQTLIHSGYSKDRIDEVIELMIDILHCQGETMRINQQNYSLETIKSKFLKLNDLHIQYVLDCMDKNTEKIHNIRNYLITALFNAPSTMSSYYQAEVNNDINNGKWG